MVGKTPLLRIVILGIMTALLGGLSLYVSVVKPTEPEAKPSITYTDAKSKLQVGPSQAANQSLGSTIIRSDTAAPSSGSALLQPAANESGVSARPVSTGSSGAAGSVPNPGPMPPTSPACSCQRNTGHPQTYMCPMIACAVY